MVAHTFNSIMGRQMQVALYKFEANLVYIVSSRNPQSYIARRCFKTSKQKEKFFAFWGGVHFLGAVISFPY